MIVKELIENLEKMNPDATVYMYVQKHEDPEVIDVIEYTDHPDIYVELSN